MEDILHPICIPHTANYIPHVIKKPPHPYTFFAGPQIIGKKSCINTKIGMKQPFLSINGKLPKHKRAFDATIESLDCARVLCFSTHAHGELKKTIEGQNIDVVQTTPDNITVQAGLLFNVGFG